MKIGPWRLALERYVIGHLPGQWRVSRSGLLVREPADWLLCAVLPGHRPTVEADALVQLLAPPREHLVLNRSHPLTRGRPEVTRMPAPRTEAECEPFGALMLKLITEEALPFLDRNGSLDGYLDYLEGRTTALAERDCPRWLDINVDEELFCVHVLRGDRDAALQAAEWADLAAAADDGNRGWVDTVHRRVREAAVIAERDLAEAVEVLRRRAAGTRAALGVEED